MAKPTPRGQFVWHECMTSDPAGAQQFYTKVVGWGTQPWGPDGSYTLWMNGEVPVGGCMALPAEVKAARIPPHWLSYIGTPDLDATCKDATARGGKVLKGPEQIPTVGRFAVVADPGGATFCAFTAEGDPPGPAGVPGIGEFSWHELMVPDPVQALEFYSDLFGWEKMGEFDMGAMGMYTLFGLKGVQMGGIMRKPDQVPVPNWQPYAKVASADESATRAKANGGTLMIEPMEVPGGDRIAVGTDPQGAVFAVHSAKPA
jgi:uncharacterized protein